MEGLAAYSGSCSDRGLLIVLEETFVNMRISCKFVIVYFREIFCFIALGKFVLGKNFTGQFILVKS